VWVHANGDRAQDMVLTSVEAAKKAFHRDDARHRIEHFAHFLTQDSQRTEERLVACNEIMSFRLRKSPFCGA
jgi:predicted amidohydrolase YtcJ